MHPMNPLTLLNDWLTGAPLRSSSRIEYQREVTRWLTWCADQHPPVDPFDTGIEAVAAWSATFLLEQLAGRPFDGPDALAHIAEHHREAALTHDRRITALTQYYEAAKERGAIRLVPDLTMLRSGVDRDGRPPRRLTPQERAVLLTCIGMWGKDHARHYLRDRLIAYLLLEGLRPAEVTRVDIRHLYDLQDGTYEVRAPDYEFEAVGKKFVLEPLTAAAINAYLPYRLRPADGVHALIIGQGGRSITTGYPNMIVQQICSTHPILAQRQPPVTADALAHTGYWDAPATGS